MNVLYSMVYKYCAKSVDAEENQNDTEMVFHMTFVVYFTFMLVWSMICYLFSLYSVLLISIKWMDIHVITDR